MSTIILERIKKLFIEKFDFTEDMLSPDATLESLGLDSYDKLEFMFALEDEFKINFSERQVPNTVQDVIDIIEKLLSEQHKKV
ncbi:MAG: acyl carrier protein [Planctomycetota bacterium]|nr:acyl carrier protein [Planctomycetota bacterium]MDE2217789.1 acyl carrier protein [Planctomycetota bacterium]